MFENTVELAENKLLLLYTLNKIKFPISNNQITQIILENNFLNYFTLQQYLLELSSSNLIRYVDSEGRNRICVTDQGIKVLEFFSNRMSKEKVDKINSYLLNNMDNIKKELSLCAEYNLEGKNSYIVNLKATENEVTILNISVKSDSKEEADLLCSKWKKDNSKLYKKILAMLKD